MDFDTLVGTALTVAAVSVIVGLYTWSVRIIERIRRKDLTTLRQIRKELTDGDGGT